MAEQEKSSKPRLVKNPETFRQRVVKANLAEATPNKTKSKITSALRAIFSPISNSLKTMYANPAVKNALLPLRFIGKIIFPKYFRNSFKELKLVTWPTINQSRKLTTAVLIFAIIFGTVIAGVDYGLDKVFKNLLLK